MKHLGGAPLPAIAEEPEERAWEERIGDLLREVNRSQAPSAGRLILRGGTAAKIGHGLTRPSRDIDADVIGPADVWAILREGAHRAGLTALAKPDRRRTQKGQLVLSDPRTGTASVEVDVRTIREPKWAGAIESMTIVERRHGILMYNAHELIRQKIEMATEPGRRRRAKDRYDIAWWLRNRPECVAPEQRVALDRALRGTSELKEKWDETHPKDRIMQRINSATVHDALMRTLDCDPVVLWDRSPDGTLHINIHMTGGATLAWQEEPETEERSEIATLGSDNELETFMVQMGLWEQKEVPERLKELTLERERARARTMSRT